VHQDLGVATRAEYVATLFQFVAKLWMVIDLAVVGNDDLPIFVRKRLGTASDVDDAEPDVRQPYPLSGVESVAIRSAVPNRCRHATEQVKADRGRGAAGYSGYAAH
jgi:hypothetical protein